MLRGKQFVVSVYLSIALGLAYSGWHRSRDFAFVDAAARGDAAAVRGYLAHGVRADAVGASGMTAIKYAAADDHADIVRLLLDKGADPNSAMDYALQRGHSRIAELLIGAGADVSGTRGEAALCYAAQSGDISTAALLLHRGININCRAYLETDSDMTPLLCAASTGSWEMFDFLRRRGADITARSSSSHETALMFAAGSTTEEGTRICRYLIQQGADVNATAEGGDTALTIAAQNENSATLATLDILLKSGANPKAEDRYGRTALSYAHELGDEQSEARLRQAEAQKQQS